MPTTPKYHLNHLKFCYVRGSNYLNSLTCNSPKTERELTFNLGMLLNFTLTTQLNKTTPRFEPMSAAIEDLRESLVEILSKSHLA